MNKVSDQPICDDTHLSISLMDKTPECDKQTERQTDSVGQYLK